MKKFFAIVLAAVMALAVIPTIAFAEETPAPATEYSSDEIVEAWGANYSLFLDYLFENKEFLAYNYTAANEDNLKNTATMLEITSLNDEYWYDSVSGNVAVENAEKLICALIEKVSVEYNNTVVNDILAVLNTATDVYDFIEKVGKYSDSIADVTESLSGTFEVIGIAAKIGDRWVEERADLIDAYSRLLSIQAANEYFFDMLEYVKANTTYDVLKTACSNLIADFSVDMDTAINDLCLEAAGDMTQFGAQWAIEVAANSNVYTAAVLKAYNISGCVADFLWNASDKYEFIDELITLYYLNDSVNNWAKAAYDTDSEKAVYAVGVLIGARALGEEALYKYKLNDAGSFIGKVKEKLQATVFEEYEVALLKLDIIHDAFFETDIADYVPVVAEVVAYCPVDITFIDVATPVYTIKNGYMGTVKNETGIYGSAYCAASQDYLKVAYLYGTYTVKMVGTDVGYVTYIMNILGRDGKFNDWSFTDVAVAVGTTITVSTKASDAPVYMYKDAGEQKTVGLNDEFVYSENPQVTIGDIGGAVGDVVKDEGKTFMDKIREFFQNLFASLFNIFKKK